MYIASFLFFFTFSDIFLLLLYPFLIIFTVLFFYPNFYNKVTQEHTHTYIHIYIHILVHTNIFSKTLTYLHLHPSLSFFFSCLFNLTAPLISAEGHHLNFFHINDIKKFTKLIRRH